MVGRSILIADDELGIRDLFHFILEPLGFEVVTAENGLEALARLRERAFDLVILDVHMPKMGGPATLSNLRELRPMQKVIVVCSSDPTRNLEVQLVNAGALDCLFKPLELDALIGAIERALATPDARSR